MPKKETQFNLDGLEEIANDQPVDVEAQQASEQILTDQQMEDVKAEVELEKEFGDQDFRTFLESGASAASFGISDQVIAKFGGEEAIQALRERRKRNTEAAITGEVAGIVGPALLSGGTSLAAKGASAGVRAAAKAGSFVEKISAKQLARVVQQTGRKKLAKSIITKSIPKTAGSAVEGAFYGAGQLVSEDALGTAEFNAENLIASAGVGALLGGAVGGVLGTSEVLAPIIKNNRITDVISKKINKNINKSFAGAKLAKLSTSEMAKLKETKWGQQIWDNIPNYFKDNLKLKVTDGSESLFKKSSNELTRLGEEIGETALQIDKLAKGTNILPTKSKVAITVQNSLEELKKVFKGSPDELAKKSLKKIDKRIKSWDEWLTDTNPLKATEIKELKTNLQKVSKWNKSIDSIPLDGKMDRQVAEAVRKEFLNLADNVSTVDNAIGEKLRKLNIDYGTSLEITNKLKRFINKDSSKEFIDMKDLLVGGVADAVGGSAGLATGAVVTRKFLQSDLKNKLVLLTSLEKANLKINKQVSSGIKSFFEKGKKASVPVSTKILLKTNLSLPEENGKRGKQPQNKKEAFQKLSKDLTNFQQNPEQLSNFMATNSENLMQSAPATGSVIQTTLFNAINFLADRLPKSASTGSNMFQRPYEPSTIELAKFERYLATIEDPMSAIEDLQSGTLTTEAVEVLAAVYPDLYSRIRQEAVNHIAETPTLDYNKKIQLGMLLDIASDASLEPVNITGLQQAFADEEQQQNAAKKQQNAIPTTQTGLSKINFAEDKKTQAEKIQTKS